MSKKFLMVLIVLAALFAVQVGAAYAAPLATTLPDGKIVSITQGVDGSLNVIFTVVTESGGTQTTTVLTPAEAVAAGLVTDNGDGTFTINNVVGQWIKNGLLSNPCTLPDGTNQPVAAAMTTFFCGTLGLDYATLQTLQGEGFGYGEIAQACFMADALGGDLTTCQQILMDKQSKDFSNLSSCGTSTNWGQLKKCVAVQALDNLGGIMSGQLTPGQSGRSNGQGNGHSNNGHSNNGHGH